MKYQIEAKPYGSYDVVVCGGGTAGCFAAIAAAREGAKTLLVERTFTVGGMLTVGEAGITKFSEHCRDVDKYKNEVLDELGRSPEKVQVVRGLSHEYVKRMIDGGTALGTHGEAGSYVFTDKAEAQWVLMQMLKESGVEVLYDTRVVLVNKKEDTVTGVVVCNKEGFCEIGARVVIDATGDADVAALAGVPFYAGATEEEVAAGFAAFAGEMQHFGTMYRVRNVDYARLFDYLKVNPERYHQHEFGVMSYENARENYEAGEMCVFRIRLGEYNSFPGSLGLVQVYNLPEKDEAILLGPGCGTGSDDSNGLDARILSNAQYTLQNGARRLTEILRAWIPGFENVRITYIPDVGVRETRHIAGEYRLTVIDVLSGKDFEDSIACGGHPLDIHPLPKEVENVDLNHWRFHIPYRVMLPLNVENLLVAGRPISAERGASGATRPTAQCMALGEAAGVAAAMAVKEHKTPKTIDVQALRARLVENGAII
ncbi:MAG: FAD-dependent oxidoreductase [Clostridia bacterium]|nr:FAD-dependent oxidoreductase [Clostridia bacterium]